MRNEEWVDQGNANVGGFMTAISRDHYTVMPEIPILARCGSSPLNRIRIF